MDIKIELQRQGYRPLSESMWAKPIGCGISCIDLNTKEMSFKFADLEGTISIWASIVLNFDEDIRSQICQFETHRCRLSFINEDWGFLTIQEQNEQNL